MILKKVLRLRLDFPGLRGHPRKAMRMTLIAVAGLSVAAGGCSLGSLSGPAAYSSLSPQAAVAQPPVAPPAVVPAPAAGEDRVAALPPGFEPAPVSERMPGDLIRPIPQGTAGRVDPGAALSASERARSHWETLKPGAVKTQVPLMARIARGENGESTPAAATVASSAIAAGNYDREDTMQKLVKGGKSAGKAICSGC
ncbi:hypothetical protein [Methylobacterium komagatae]|uniref:hypothetical protein n=1 Tax=Methylobacterium komagatae TaxID=374425 RepID=UPI00366B299F